MRSAAITTMCLLAVFVVVVTAGQARHRYVIKPVQIPGEPSNLNDQFSQEFLTEVERRLGTNGDPNFEVFLETDKRIKPCHAPFVTCDVVNLAQLFRQLQFPLVVNGNPNALPKHGKVHQATCSAESQCWREAIVAAAACIRLHHEVVHLGRPPSKPRLCNNVAFGHGGAQ